MVIRELDRFNELANSLGNKYQAIKLVSAWARDLGKQYSEYHIDEAKLLDWVINGRCPYLETELEKRKSVYTDDGVDEFLMWVSDEAVTDEVKRLYKKSIRSHQLIYCSKSDFNKAQISRCNILLRMLWYSANSKEGEIK